DLHQHLLSVKTNLVRLDVAKNSLLAVVQAIGTEMPFLFAAAVFVVVAGVIGNGAALIEDPIINQAQVSVVTGSYLETNDAVLNSVEVDLDWFLFFFPFLLILLFVFFLVLT